MCYGGTDGVGEPGQRLWRDHVRRHQINQPTKRTDPHALFNKELLQRRHINRLMGFHYANRAQHAYVGDLR